MALLDRYHDYGNDSAVDSVQPAISVDIIEEAKLQAFENGYQAGWDDAVAAQTDQSERVRADLVQNLQDMSFTYHEAYAKLCMALQPLLTQVVSKFLPQVVQHTIAPLVLQHLQEMMASEAEGAIEIAISPDDFDLVTDLLNGAGNVPFNAASDKTLGSGQVHLRVNSSEREIDFNTVLTELSSELAAFYQSPNSEQCDG